MALPRKPDIEKIENEYIQKAADNMEKVDVDDLFPKKKKSKKHSHTISLQTDSYEAIKKIASDSGMSYTSVAEKLIDTMLVKLDLIKR